MSGYHALRSPSAAKRWVDCTASADAQAGRPHTTSEASRMGTCGHQIGEECLISGADPQTYLGRVMGFHADGEDWVDKLPTLPLHEVAVTQEMIDGVTAYVNYVRTIVSTQGGELLVEQSVPIGQLTGEDGATGSADAIILTDDTLTVVDLKMGRSPVKAYETLPDGGTRMNLQLAMYLLGALHEHGLLHDIRNVKGVIVQPMIGKVSEYGCTVSELEALGRWISDRADVSRKNPEFKPSHDNCFFCKARFDCHARNAHNLEACLDGFDDVPNATLKIIPIAKLGDIYAKLAHIRAWADDIEQKVFTELSEKRPVVMSNGSKLKLVDGKQGNRKWDDPAEVEKLMQDFRMKSADMYKRTLITPTEAEKISSKKKGDDKPIGKTQWAKLAQKIKREPAKPQIAFQDDPRPERVEMDDDYDLLS